MSLLSVEPTPERAPPSPEDRILLAGGSARTIDLLRLATIRSDDVVLMASAVDEATRLYAERFAVEWIARAATADDIATCTALLIAIDDIEAGNKLVRAARRRGVPVHVIGRPLVSDITMLDFLEGRRTASPQPRVWR